MQIQKIEDILRKKLFNYSLGSLDKCIKDQANSIFKEMEKSLDEYFESINLDSPCNLKQYLKERLLAKDNL